MTRPEIKALTKQMMDGFLSVCEESSASHEPRALVIMGQPGSGVFKAASRLQKEYFTRDGGWERPAVVCEENFRYRSVSGPPANHSDTTMKDAHALERSCIKALAAARRNILLFARSSNGDAASETIKIIKKAGYRVEAVVLAVPGKISAAKAIFEYEWLKQKRGMAPMPLVGWHRDSLHCLAPISFTVESYKLTDRIRVLDGNGNDLHAADIPLSNKKTRSRDSILREQSRTLTLDEHRRCLELLAAVASGMDRRDAPADERRIVSGFINMQFAGSPEALYISNTRIAKITENAGGDPPKTGSGKIKGHESTSGVPNGQTGWYVNRYLSACEKPEHGKPRALVVIGPPGAGTHKAAAALQGGYFANPGAERTARQRPAVVSVEDFRYPHRLAKKLLARHLNIHMDSVSREARRMERGCLKALVEAGRDIVWLTRGEFKDATHDSLDMMQSCGYKVETVFLAAPGKISAARALFEYEWLKDKTGMAFMPMARCHNDSFRFLSHICRAVTEDRLADRVRVLDGEGGELNISDIPLLGLGERPHGVMLREQSREISPDENRRCLEMLTAVADGMDRRDAPLDERYIVAAFIRGQFAGCPEAIYISKTRIGKNQPKAGWQTITPAQEEAAGC